MKIVLDDLYRGLPPSPTLRINERVSALRREGRTVHHLGFGESRFPTPDPLLQAFVDASREKSYLPALGLAELRQSVARYLSRRHDLDLEEGRVIIGPGSKALIYALQMVVKANVYLPSPSWVSYAPQARMLGKTVRYVPSKVEADYSLNLAALEELLEVDEAQKLLVINSPNNPTGRMLSEETLEPLAELCRSRNVLVLSDEIYADIVHGERPHVSLATYYPEGTFILTGLSKHLSLGGWRLGAMVVPEGDAGRDALRAMEAAASEIWSAVTAPVQRAAVTAYGGLPEIEQHIDVCAGIHGLRTGFLHDGLQALGIHCPKPQGAFYLMPNFDRWRLELARLDIRDSEALAHHLLDRHRIAALPGSVFGLAPETLSLRLSSSYLDMETDAQAERLLAVHQSGVDAGEFMSPRHHPNLHAALDAFREFVGSLSGAEGDSRPDNSQ